MNRAAGNLIAALCSCVSLWLVAGCGEGSAAGASGNAARGSVRTLVLGMDGMDYELLKKWMAEGRLPNFQKVAERGCFHALGTSMPPQSPVAWSNFIAGADPGTHQIYDFIHRRVKPRDKNLVVEAYFSTADVVEDPRWYNAILPNTIGLPGSDAVIPLVGQKMASMRRGASFWDSLVERGVDTTIYRMPANYPPPVAVKGRGVFRCLCGMGTPDALGSYGYCTNFKEDMAAEESVVGGTRSVRLDVSDDRAVANLRGPENPFRKPPASQPAGAAPAAEEDESEKYLKTAIEFVRDAREPSATLTICGKTLLMKEGEWSEWVPIEFRAEVAGQSALSATGVMPAAAGMVRFYLKGVHPNLNVYVSPVNIDPVNQLNAISAPQDFATELARRGGRYYTTGIPEDTKALTNNVLTEDEFLEMVDLLRLERTRQYHDALAEFEHGFLFFYFGHTDQLAHIFWRDMDPGHPGYVAAEAEKYRHVVRDAYGEMDVRVGEALARLDEDDVLIIMSDHGFSSFRRGVNVNTWLSQTPSPAGPFLVLNTPQPRGWERDDLNFVDWSRTRAYAIGINSIYLNQAGREQKGIVPTEQRRSLLEEISKHLLALRDDNGTQVVEKVYIVEDEYAGADPEIAPDILVGYADNYRGSWATTMGGYKNRVIENNKERWSGDHCIAAYLVPGVYVSNRPIVRADPTLIDVAPTILGIYGIPAPGKMKGRDLLAK